MLDYRIKTLLCVAEEGTLKKASDKLCLTQPAVSQHLKALEELFGMPLFSHQGRSLVLNDAGKAVIESARKCDAETRNLERKLENLKEGIKQYKLGATLTIGEFILPHYLGQFREQYPDQELSILIENTRNILALLNKGEIDLALIEGPFDPKGFHSELFLKDEMIFIASEKYLSPKQKMITEKEIAKSRLILREPGSGTRYYWEKYVKSKEMNLQEDSLLMEVGSLSTIKSLVESGVGCSVMSRFAVQRELESGSLITAEFESGPLFRDMFFVYTDHSPEIFIRDFISFCRINKLN